MNIGRSVKNIGLSRLWIGCGSLAGVTAVAMAAAAAHGPVPDRLTPAALQQLRNGIEMHGWHALALLAVGLWAPRGGRLADAAGAAFVLGLLAFCGAVYGLVLGGWHIGRLAPTGGVLLMAGWLLLGVSALRAR